MAAELIEAIPSPLEKTLKANLVANEVVEVKLKGAFKEALVCTDRRLMILKSGFLTGQMFGSDIFQLPFSGVASAEVKYRILSGYFEVSAGGMQNTSKSYWSTNAATDPAKAPNCVALNSKAQANVFRQACAHILQKADEARRGPAPASSPAATSAPDMASQLQSLWALKVAGALTDAEFESAKAKLIS